MELYVRFVMIVQEMEIEELNAADALLQPQVLAFVVLAKFVLLYLLLPNVLT